MQNILEYLENTATKFSNKVAYANEYKELTFKELLLRSKSIGTFLNNVGAYKEPVIIYMKKSPETISAFLGTIYSRCYYVPIDEEMPKKRVNLILQNTNARFLIYDNYIKEKINNIDFHGQILDYDVCINTKIEENILKDIRNKSLDIDPIYVLYTSGSTGIPKGVVGYHRALIDYIENLDSVLHITNETIFANQNPFYWDACLKDVFLTLKCGATNWIVPKEYFMFPIKLVEYLNEHKVNTLCWVVSALTIVSSFNTFESVMPKYLKTIVFGGEVFPIKQFNIWKSTFPNVDFYNMYGPAEATGVQCYYHATRMFENNEVIPIGKPFNNIEILLLDSNKEVKDGKVGEMCIHGSCLTHGYYNNKEKTKEVFVQNPLNNEFNDYIYRTGDLAYKDNNGNYVFVSRQDYQIKHMGQRIELGEIESNVEAVEGIRDCCCIFIHENKKIVLFYTGTISKRDLTKELRNSLPRYMLPNSIIQLDMLPLTTNGKKNRIEMEQIYLNRKRRG